MSLFDDLREQNGSGLAWTVTIRFPNFEEYVAKDFYFSTAINLEIGDGNNYRDLVQMVRGRHQDGRGNDYAEFNLLNANSALFNELKDYLILLEMAEVEINECLLLEDNFWIAERRFDGFLQDYTFDDKNKTLNFTCVSDMSKEGRVVGQVITRDRCDAEFPYNGSLNPEYELCGWTQAQGGNPHFCTRKEKGKDGCIDHNNRHKFHALTGLNGTPVTIIPSDQSSSGFEYKSDATNFDYYYTK